MSVKMGYDDGFNAGRPSLPQQAGGNGEMVLIDVDEHRPCPRLLDRAKVSEIVECGYRDLIARANSDRAERNFDRGGAAGSQSGGFLRQTMFSICRRKTS